MESMSENSNETIIAKGTEFQGAVKSDCPVTLGGKLDGEIAAPSLNVEQGGTVSGRVEVTDLDSEGEIRGQIIAENVRLSGRVGDSTVILASTLEVKLKDAGEGLQVSFGNCELQVGEQASKKGSLLQEVTEEQENRDSPVPVAEKGSL
jgi:cytoskeletal protein CcmA (bactofilin family)